MSKVVIGVFNPGESPADNGRMVHALQLAAKLDQAGADIVLMFEGQAVKWIGRFVNRTEESHPFEKNYGPVFDALRSKVRACNMCCKRFDQSEIVAGAGIPILGEGRDHVDIAQYVLDGYQVINH